jgi:hypothetical protein
VVIAVSGDAGVVAGQVLGIPAPPGFVPVLIKYVACGAGPWRRAGLSLCRILRSYSPESVEEASVVLPRRWDPRYGAFMPYIGEGEIAWSVDPETALQEALRRAEPPLLDALSAAVREVEATGASAGVTGSLALGAPHRGSDVDLVVIADEGSVAGVVERFRSLGEPDEVSQVAYRGVFTSSPRVGWRRRRVSGVRVTLTAAPRRPAEHCPPISSYERLKQPHGNYRGVLTVRPGQPSALLYPPCVESDEGLTIVSYEYNLALELYEGGRFHVEGPSNGEAVFVSVRESRSSILRLR